jgi:hypothetical protein
VKRANMQHVLSGSFPHYGVTQGHLLSDGSKGGAVLRRIIIAHLGTFNLNEVGEQNALKMVF